MRSINDTCNLLDESITFCKTHNVECEIEGSRITFYEVGYHTFSSKNLTV